MLKKNDNILNSNRSIKILAFDASSEACSAALFIGKNLMTRLQIAPQQHNRLLLPMVESLLTEANVKLNDLDALAFSHGPGSFTGLRMAAGIAQGLALGANLPVIVVSSLQAIAQSCYRRCHCSYALVALDARMSQIYIGKYKINNQFLMEEISSDRLIDIDDFSIPENNEHWVATGSAWAVYKDLLSEKIKASSLKIELDCFPEAEDIARLAQKKFLLGEYDRGDNIMPNYLRQENAWKIAS